MLLCKMPIYLFQIHLSHKLNLFGDISALQIPAALNVLLLLLSSLWVTQHNSTWFHDSCESGDKQSTLQFLCSDSQMEM